MSIRPEDAPRDQAAYHRMLDQYEMEAAEIPARIDACANEAEAVAIIKQWLCDDHDLDLIVEAWERKARTSTAKD